MREFLRGAVRLHILHHAAMGEIHGAWMAQELGPTGIRGLHWPERLAVRTSVNALLPGSTGTTEAVRLFVSERSYIVKGLRFQGRPSLGSSRSSSRSLLSGLLKREYGCQSIIALSKQARSPCFAFNQSWPTNWPTTRDPLDSGCFPRNAGEQG